MEDNRSELEKRNDRIRLELHQEAMTPLALDKLKLLLAKVETCKDADKPQALANLNHYIRKFPTAPTAPIVEHKEPEHADTDYASKLLRDRLIQRKKPDKKKLTTHDFISGDIVSDLFAVIVIGGVVISVLALFADMLF